MTLIFFVHEDSSRTGVTFKNIMGKNFNTIGIQIFQTIHTFRARLKQASRYDREIFVLLADSTDRLNELTSLIDLVEDRRIVLILPDDSKETLSWAHRFFPRFFTFVNDSYEDLCSVLIKMINQKNHKY